MEYLIWFVLCVVLKVVLDTFLILKLEKINKKLKDKVGKL